MAIAVKPTIQDISQALQRCTLIYAAEVLEKIEKEECRLSRKFAKTPTSCDRLFEVYDIRNEGLKNQKSRHARQLHTATEELLENLSKNLDKACFINDFESDEEYDFVVFYEPTQKEMVGVLKSVSKLKVSHERWCELWTLP